jgi:hypothetical protein
MVTRALVLAVFVLAALAGAVVAQPMPPAPPVPEASGAAVSHAIFPTQHLPLRFDHARHLRIGGVTCVRCHATATTSDTSADRLLPGESQCTPCHAIDRGDPWKTVAPGAPPARCDACHVGWRAEAPQQVARAAIPAPNLHFSHRAHVARGQRCESCHASVRRVALATRLELPSMRSCLTCHRPGGTAPDRCATCHLTEADGVLRSRFPEGWLNPPVWMRGLHHDADFWFTHRISAAQDATRCAVCHRDEDCAACHDGRVRDRRIHPNDYLTQHPVDARINPDRCGSCHRQASFCVGCHDRAGVSLGAAPSARAQGRFHPPAALWSGPTVTVQHHGVEARRSLSACVSCHAEQDCVACHATRRLGGASFSPHPPGFLARCGLLLRASARPCARCHDDLDELAARCR